MRDYHNILDAAQSFESAWGFIFDMDGLIFDTERLFMEQLAVVMAERGYRLSREVYCKSLGLTGKSLEKLMLTEYGMDYPFAQLGRIAREHVDAIAATVGLELKPDIVTLLQWIRRQGLKAAVASSTRSDIVERYLEGAGIRKYFSVIVGGEMVERSKPEPDIFLKAAEKAHAAPADCCRRHTGNLCSGSENAGGRSAQDGKHRCDTSASGQIELGYYFLFKFL